jgi:hypothetical protein
VASLHARVFWFTRDEWFDAWIASYEDLLALERALQKVWGSPTAHGSQGIGVQIQIRGFYTLEATFSKLDGYDNETLIKSVFRVLGKPVTLTPQGVLEHILDLSD